MIDLIDPAALPPTLRAILFGGARGRWRAPDGRATVARFAAPGHPFHVSIDRRPARVVGPYVVVGRLTQAGVTHTDLLLRQPQQDNENGVAA